jgi:S-formylglutathione hydrolase FrmB
VLGLALLTVFAVRVSSQDQPLRFLVQSPALGEFSGRVVVYLGTGNEEPRFGPNWFSPKPCYSADVKNADAKKGVTISNGVAVGYPGKLKDLVPGEYTVQAVFDRNLGGRAIGDSAGNLYSIPITLKLDPHSSGLVKLTCDQVVEDHRLTETDRVKEFRLESPLLSAWYKRPTFLKAAVLLPEAYAAEPNRKFPIYYEIPGFGGDAVHVGAGAVSSTLRDKEQFIVVILDPNCPTGHCVFADSANNGPWGQALTTELIPALEKQYRTFGVTDTRYVGGHSSGGWSSLWLQVAYPEVFGGVWSTSPDPVDFRDFQKIDLYQPGVNMFTDPAGDPRPLARQGGKAILFYKPFSDMERPIRGEQLGSFEAVFSPKGKDGQPVKLWNRDTGAVDMNVSHEWQKYDIDLKLRSEWSTIAPKLAGKLHVFTGDVDTFYLEGAVRLLKTDLSILGSDAEIEIVPGDHFTMMSQALRTKINHEMAESFRKWRTAHSL